MEKDYAFSIAKEQVNMAEAGGRPMKTWGRKVLRNHELLFPGIAVQSWTKFSRNWTSTNVGSSRGDLCRRSEHPFRFSELTTPVERVNVAWHYRCTNCGREKLWVSGLAGSNLNSHIFSKTFRMLPIGASEARKRYKCSTSVVRLPCCGLECVRNKYISFSNHLVTLLFKNDRKNPF